MLKIQTRSDLDNHQSSEVRDKDMKRSKCGQNSWHNASISKPLWIIHNLIMANRKHALFKVGNIKLSYIIPISDL